jgi:hypothetical protein
MSEPETQPRRPRRRLITPWTLGLGAVIVAAAGFIAGVNVQKGQASTTATAAGPGGFAAQLQRPTADGAAPVTGQVESVDGRTLYVKGADGTTVKVKTTSGSKVTRNAKSQTRAVHPGDTVVVTGTRAKSGTMTAAQVTATASGVSAGGFGGFGGGGGGRPGNSQGSPSVSGNDGGG